MALPCYVSSNNRGSNSCGRKAITIGGEGNINLDLCSATILMQQKLSYYYNLSDYLIIIIMGI